MVWAAEAYGSDSPTVLAWLAAQTTRIHVGSAVMQIPGRTPAMAAMTAASLDVLTGGRFRLGLGVSGPQVSEGWHGVRFAQPLARTREYLGIVQQALSRQTLAFSGDHYQLPLPDGPGKPLKLSIAPASDHIPIYLAAIGPKNLELAGELADGWLAVFFAPGYATEQLGQIEAGRPEGGQDALRASTWHRPFRSWLATTRGRAPTRSARTRPSIWAAWAAGEQNFYNALAVRMGFEEAAATVQDLFLSGRQRDARAAVPYEFIDETSLLGDRSRIAERLRAFSDVGVTTCSVMPYGDSVEEKLNALTAVAEALEVAAVGD